MPHPVFLSVALVPILLASLRFASPVLLPALAPPPPMGRSFFKIERATMKIDAGAYQVMRYQRWHSLGEVSGDVWNTMQSVVEKARIVTGDPTIQRLVSMNGRPIKKFADLPRRFVALNGVEHFYYPFLGDGVEHDISGLTDRPIKMIDRSGGPERPRVLELHNFLSEEECDTIVTLAKARGLQASGLVLTKDQKLADFANTRTSTGVFVDYWSDPVLDRLAWRTYNITTVPAHHSEDLQVIHYDPMQHYHAHWDHIGDDTKDSKSWWKGVKDGHPEDNRYLTVLLYLSDVEKGGETVFPRTNPNWSAATDGYDQRLCAETYPALKVRPKRGNAVLFYNVPEREQASGERDEYSLHGGCDPIAGEKWAANFWVHLWEWREIPEKQRAFLTLSPDDHDH